MPRKPAAVQGQDSGRRAPARWLDDHGHRLPWALAGVITLLAAALRVPGLGEFWLNPDEGIYYSVISWPNLAQRQAEIAENAHPPFYYHLLWAWSRVSMDLAWLRAPSAIAGTLAVFGSFLLGRQLVGGRCGTVTGLLGALLLAIAPAAVNLSQVIRPYALQLALITFALLGLARWHDRGSRPALAAGTLCLTVALFTHYSSAFAVAGAAAPFLVLLARRQLPRRALVELAAAAGVLATAALVVYLVEVRPLAGSELHARSFATWLRPHLANDAAQVWRQALGVFAYLWNDEPTGREAIVDALAGAGLVAFLLALIAAMCLRMPRLWIAPCVTFAIAAAASRWHLYPLGPARHSTYLVPFLVVPTAWVIAKGLTSGNAWRVVTLAALGLLLHQHERIYLALAGNKRVPRLGNEKVLRRSDLTRAQPALDQVRTTPGLLVMSADSYMTLGPLWQQERQAARLVDGMRLWRWGARDVLVHSAWTFGMLGSELGKGWHLHDFLVAADAKLPELQIGKQRPTVLFAGFGAGTAQMLAAFDRERPPAERLVSNVRGTQSCILLDLDAARFLAARAELLRVGR